MTVLIAQRKKIDETWACCRNSGAFDKLLLFGFVFVNSEPLTSLQNSINHVGKVRQDPGVQFYQNKFVFFCRFM
jgi:hypothetical protein